MFHLRYFTGLEYAPDIQNFALGKYNSPLNFSQTFLKSKNKQKTKKLTFSCCKSPLKLHLMVDRVS